MFSSDWQCNLGNLSRVLAQKLSRVCRRLTLTCVNVPQGFLKDHVHTCFAVESRSDQESIDGKTLRARC